MASSMALTMAMAKAKGYDHGCVECALVQRALHDRLSCAFVRSTVCMYECTLPGCLCRGETGLTLIALLFCDSYDEEELEILCS